MKGHKRLLYFKDPFVNVHIHVPDSLDSIQIPKLNNPADSLSSPSQTFSSFGQRLNFGVLANRIEDYLKYPFSRKLTKFFSFFFIVHASAPYSRTGWISYCYNNLFFFSLINGLIVGAFEGHLNIKCPE